MALNIPRSWLADPVIPCIFHGIVPSNTGSSVVNLRAYMTDIICGPFNVKVFILLHIFCSLLFFSEEIIWS